jgi:hypothetical protein
VVKIMPYLWFIVILLNLLPFAFCLKGEAR